MAAFQTVSAHFRAREELCEVCYRVKAPVRLPEIAAGLQCEGAWYDAAISGRLCLRHKAAGADFRHPHAPAAAALGGLSA